MNKKEWLKLWDKKFDEKVEALKKDGYFGSDAERMAAQETSSEMNLIEFEG
jgi:hypothetical protein